MPLPLSVRHLRLGVKGIKPVFNTRYTMRWCLDSGSCSRSTNTYCGIDKAAGLCQNTRMSVYTVDHPFLVEYDGYVRAQVIRCLTCTSCRVL